MISSQTQGTLTTILEDKAWTQGYLQRNRARLAAASSAVCAILDRIGLPYVRPAAALFVFIDMRLLLMRPPGGLAAAAADASTGDTAPASHKWEEEHALFITIAHECNVLLTPGHDCCASEAGWFRCCFTGVDDAGLEDGFGRIARHFNLPRVSQPALL